ncbi:MAG: FtsW/RodA/SpoVE family cell cycle protein, partial [Desulfobulbus sp.]|nr:FtsW/RodA/SpoVE family cell cycle protein [Desulfobulbus sp.]
MFHFDRRLLQNFDWVMLMMLIIVAGLSFINLYSSSYIPGKGASPIFYKQITFFISGLVIMSVILFYDYHKLIRLSYVLYAAILVLLLYTLLFEKPVAGVQRWIDLGFFNVQPSEPAKLSLILVLAACFTKTDAPGGYRLRHLIKPAILTLLPFVLILKQPDRSTAFICYIIFASMTLFVRMRWQTLHILVITTISSVYVVFFKPLCNPFFNPEAHIMDNGYQVMQSKIAVGSGKIFGKGFLDGTLGHFQFLAEKHTDFAFAVWAEEWGFSGSVFLLGCYFFLLIWGLNVAMSAKDKLGSILAF